MIQKWKYVEPPEDVDLTVDLMPDRAEDDDKLYGIDPAWLREVVSVWLTLIGDVPAHVEMPPYPDSEYTNAIRTLARGLKLRQDNPSGIVDNKLLLTQRPTTPFGLDYTGETNQYAVKFGVVPEDVECGDPVQRSDVMDMYDWMNKDVNYLRFHTWADYTLSQQVQSGTDGNGQLPTPVGNSVIYCWEWYYSNGTHSDEYGYWRRTKANDFTISFTVAKVSTQFVKSPTIYIQAHATNYTWDDYEMNDLYIPLTNVQMQDTTDGLRITATVNVMSIFNTFGYNEIPYKGDLHGDADYKQGYQQLMIHIGATDGNAQIVGFLEVKSDYKHPDKQ